MTFTRIGGTLDRRRADFENLRAKKNGAATVVAAFLKESFGEKVASQCTIHYALGVLTVGTPEKKSADFLRMRTGELSALVRAERFTLKRILIS